MVISSAHLWTIFLVGCLGGCLGEVARWYQLRETGLLPQYAKKVFYWLITLAMIAAGGGLAVIYGLKDPQALLVVNIGLSAPLIIKTLAANVPSSQPTGVAPPPKTPRVQQFLAGR